MKGSSTAGDAALIFVVMATAFFIMADAGDDATSCANVAKMTWSDACFNISSTPAAYNLCQETLQHVPEGSAAVTLFALEAAKVTWQSYAGTEAEAEELVRYDNGSLPGGERWACARCMEYYAVALDRMAAVMENMNACEFGATARKYGDAADAVEACAFELSGYQNSPLVALNAADGEVTKVAVDLGTLVLGDNGS